jgi:hypothetical protein
MFGKLPTTIGKPQNMFWKPRNMFGKPQNMFWKPRNMFGKLRNMFWKLRNMFGKLRNMFWKLRNMFWKFPNMFWKLRNMFGKLRNMFGKTRQLPERQTIDYSFLIYYMLFISHSQISVISLISLNQWSDLTYFAATTNSMKIFCDSSGYTPFTAYVFTLTGKY